MCLTPVLGQEKKTKTQTFPPLLPSLPPAPNPQWSASCITFDCLLLSALKIKFLLCSISSLCFSFFFNRPNGSSVLMHVPFWLLKLSYEIVEENWITRTACFAFAVSAASSLMLYMVQHCLKCETRNHFNHVIYREIEWEFCAGVFCLWYFSCASWCVFVSRVGNSCASLMKP